MNFRRSNLRKRLALAGGGVGLFLLTLVVAGPLVDRSPDAGKLGMGYDFLPAYVAGHFARTGEYARMYDRAAFSEMQTRVIREAGLEMDGRFGAGLNPPHFALLFAPLSALPYRSAAATWLAINVVLLGASIVLLARMLPAEWSLRGLVPLLVCVSMPFCQAMGHQQNTFLSLLLLAGAVTLWRSDRAFAAGIVAGLLFYKPQVALVVSLVLFADRGWRAALGLAATGLATLLLTVLVMPGALGEYLHTLPHNVDWIQNQHPYNWGRQVTFLGFWRLLIQGPATGAPRTVVKILWATSASAVAAALAVTFFRQRRTPNRDRLISASIAATPLLLPYFMDYDLLLLAVPAVLFGSEMAQAPSAPRADRRTTMAWVALYAWAYLHPGLSGLLHVSPTVPLLTAVAWGLMSRCGRAPAQSSTEPLMMPVREPTPLAA
jgi:hypothetical protein